MFGLRAAPAVLLALVVCANASDAQRAHPVRVAAPPRLFAANGTFWQSGSPPVQFIPRGADYIRLNGSQGTNPPLYVAQDTPRPHGPVYHSTFSPTLANASEWRAALATMAKWRLNVARVFVDTGAYGRSDGVASGGGVGQAPALSESYLDLLAQFVADAANAGVYTMVTLSGLPVDHAWGGAAPPQQAIVYPNAQYMDAAHVQAKALYAQLLVDGLQQRLGQAGMSALFGLSLENEAAFVGDVAPFSWTSGVVTTADGLRYDMGNTTQRQQAADSNSVHWARTCAAAVAAVNPRVQVTVGVFTFAAVGKRGPNGMRPQPGVRDPRFPMRPVVLSVWAGVNGSSSGGGGFLSFLDVHVYPLGGVQGAGGSWSVSDDLRSSEWQSVQQNADNVPVVMAEFGAFKSFFPAVAEAAGNATVLATEACKLGMAGWLYWTLDTWEQPRLWSMQEAGAVVGKALEAADPCH